MSYCRWSSDDHQCDLYAYEDSGGGYTIHVAKYRHDISGADLPPAPDNGWPWSDDDEYRIEQIDKLRTRQRAVSQYISDRDPAKIGLPSDGKSYNLPTEEAMFQKMRELKEEGYNIPESAMQ